MREIAHLDASILQQLSTRQQSSADVVDIGQRQRGLLQQVGDQNQLAAVDSLEVSAAQQVSGSFSFSFNGQTSVSWQGSGGQQINPPASFQSQFSFGFSVQSDFSVEFNQGISVNDQRMSGGDFELSRDGLLKLLEKLIEMLGAQDRPEIDLGGKLDGRALDLLEKLGLIDGEGRASMALQAMSDYAGLNRFHAGQQLHVAASFSYSARYSESHLGWQGWLGGSQGTGSNGGGSADGEGNSASEAGDVKTASGIGGANVVNGSRIGGDVTIDDRDVININIHNNEHDKA